MIEDEINSWEHIPQVSEAFKNFLSKVEYFEKLEEHEASKELLVRQEG